MKVAGWDVGIKNLAYCILSKDKNIIVEKWELLDLIEDNKFKCKSLKKDGAICNNNATYSIKKADNEIVYFCKSHESNNKVSLDESAIIKTVTEKGSCAYKKKNGEGCLKTTYTLLEDRYLCTAHKTSELNNLRKEHSKKSVKKMNCHSKDPYELCQTMYNKLDNIKELREVDEVVIENQPALKNPIMKTISSFLFGYFVHKKEKDLKVRFVSPSVKIKLDDYLITKARECIEKHMSDTKKKNHNCRLCKLENELNENSKKNADQLGKYKFSYEGIKELGVIYTIKILNENNQKTMIEFINNNSKKDDLCDAFLHAYKQFS